MWRRHVVSALCTTITVYNFDVKLFQYYVLYFGVIVMTSHIHGNKIVMCNLNVAFIE